MSSPHQVVHSDYPRPVCRETENMQFRPSLQFTVSDTSLHTSGFRLDPLLDRQDVFIPPSPRQLCFPLLYRVVARNPLPPLSQDEVLEPPRTPILSLSSGSHSLVSNAMRLPSCVGYFKRSSTQHENNGWKRRSALSHDSREGYRRNKRSGKLDVWNLRLIFSRFIQSLYFW